MKNESSLSLDNSSLRLIFSFIIFPKKKLQQTEGSHHQPNLILHVPVAPPERSCWAKGSLELPSFFGCPKMADRWIFWGGKIHPNPKTFNCLRGHRAMWLKTTHPPKVGLQRRQPSTKFRTRSAVSPWNSVR